MTDDQAKVFGALSRGRLIFPFHDERQSLHAAENEGGLTEREKEKKALLDDAFEVMQKRDAEFHASMLSGNLEAANAAVMSAFHEMSAVSVKVDEDA